MFVSGLCHGLKDVLPLDYTAAVGATVTYTTTVPPSPVSFLAITWMGPTSNNIITSSSSMNITGPEYTDRITLYTSTGSLELRNVDLNDTGEYTLTMITHNVERHYGTCKLLVLSKLMHHSFNSSLLLSIYHTKNECLKRHHSFQNNVITVSLRLIGDQFMVICCDLFCDVIDR